MADCSDIAKLLYTLSRHHAQTPGVNTLAKLSEVLRTQHKLDFSEKELGSMLTEASTARAKELTEVAKQFPKMLREAKGNTKAIAAIEAMKQSIEDVSATGEAVTPEVRKKTEPSALRKALNTEMANLRKELSELPPQRAQKLQKRIDDLQAKLDRNDFAIPVAKERAPATKELVLLEEKRRDLANKVRRSIEDARPKGFFNILQRGGLIYKMFMAGRDLSAVGVQGGFALGARPELAMTAAKDLAVALRSEGGAREARRKVEDRDNFVWYNSGDEKLALADWDGPLSAQDEAYMGDIAKTLSNIKGGIAGLPVKLIAQLTHSTGRANTIYLNTLRANWFDYIAETAYGGQLDAKKAGDINALVNLFTGHGGLGPFEKIAAGLNSSFFSPRLMSSALQQAITLFPKAVVGEVLDIAGKPNNILGGKELRRFVAKTYGRYIGLGVSLMALASMAGYDVESDSRSGNFGNISLPGGWVFNVFGNIRPVLVLISQLAPLIGGVKGRDAKIRPTVGPHASPFDRPDAKVVSFLRKKEAPSASLVHSLLTKTDYANRDTTYAAIIGNALVPIDVKNMYESATQANGWSSGVSTALAQWFGAPVNHYEVVTPKPKKHKPIY